MPIFHRLLIYFLAVGAIIGVPLIIISFEFSKDAARSRTEESISQQIAIIAANFEQEFAIGLHRSLKQITTSDALGQYLSASQDERLVNAKALETSFLRLQADYEIYSGIYYADGSGRLVASVEDKKRVFWRESDAEPSDKGIKAGERRGEAPTPTQAHFKRLFERIKTTPSLLSAGNMEWFMPPREITVEGPFIDEAGRLTLLAGLAALDFDNGAFSGIAVVRVRLDEFVGRLRAFTLFDEPTIWLFDPAGKVLLQPEKPLLSLSASDMPERKLVKDTIRQKRDDGLVAYRDLSIVQATPFVRIAYGVPDKLLARDFQSALYFFLVVLTVSSLAVLAFAYVVARHFARPIIQLADAASGLARGELASRVDVQSSGEVKVLVDSFNQMAENLEQANQNRANAFAVLRQTAAQMQTGPDALNPGQPTLESSQLPPTGQFGQEDAQDLRAISALIMQLIGEREDSLRKIREARDAAEQADRAKSQFLANMSHEIRTPLNAVLGMLKLLQSTPLTPRQGDYVGKTEGAARSLLLLLNDILDFSKVEADMMTLDLRPFRIDQVMRHLSVILSASIGNKPIEVLFDIEPSLPRWVIGDDLRLQQVLINLGGNAVKFTDAGEVVVGLRSVARSPDEIELEFSVRDTGIGIPTEQQSRIFSGFSQAEASTTRRYGGTGLGLAISRRLVQLMGGDIVLESAPGKGSVFSFRIKLAIQQLGVAEAETQAPSAAALAARPMPQLNALRALVVDDNPTARGILARMVRSLGWSVAVAGDGPEALALARQAADAGNPFDLAFIDWQMPGMDGWETGLKLRGISVDNHSSLVMMVTAHGREMLAQRSTAEQASLGGFLVKPVTASMLYDAVIDALFGQRDDQVRQAPIKASGGNLMGLRLLVVEDNLNNQQVAQELLLAEGALVELADNGRAGVEAVLNADPPFDAVLMDLQMPVMDGFTATARIRSEARLRDLPIIAMTANAMASDREACLAAGMNDHVGKPFDLGVLISILRRNTGRGDEPVKISESEGLAPELVAAARDAGLDLQTAVDRLGGNLPVYGRMLRNFLKDLPETMARLSAHRENARWREAANIAHTLKGLGGMLGAQALFEAAAATETALKREHSEDSGNALARFQAVIEQLRKIAEPIVPLLIGEGAINPAPESQMNLRARAFLDEVLPLLQSSDMRAVDLLDRLRADRAAPGGEAWQGLENAIDGLDFEQAAKRCSEMLAATATD